MHKYLTNPTVTHTDKVVNAARALCEALSKKKKGMHNNTMESLKKLSGIFSPQLRAPSTVVARRQPKTLP